MKFCKRYEEYMSQIRKEELPVVGLKRLKKTLKRCRTGCQQSSDQQHMAVQGCDAGEGADANNAVCPGDGRCPVCDETFFPSLIAEMSAVVGSFNERARKLLHMHLATGFRKYLTLVKGKVTHNHGSLVEEGRDLVTYAVINSIAMRKILKKYDKVHHSKQGQEFRSQAQTMHIEVLHSPWLCELIAFYINTREEKKGARSKKGGSGIITATEDNGSTPLVSSSPSGLFDNSSLVFEEDKPVLSCGLFDSLMLNIDLTCSICLDTVFDPVSLACGHIFCYICACGTAAVDIVDGLKMAEANAKCPLCRRAGVYKGAVRLDELTILLSRNCSEYWAKRRESERVERMKQAKQHWDAQCQAFLGF